MLYWALIELWLHLNDQQWEYRNIVWNMLLTVVQQQTDFEKQDKYLTRAVSASLFCVSGLIRVNTIR